MVVYATDVQISERLKGGATGNAGAGVERSTGRESEQLPPCAGVFLDRGRTVAWLPRRGGRVIVIAQEQIAAIVEPPGTATAGADRA